MLSGGNYSVRLLTYMIVQESPLETALDTWILTFSPYIPLNNSEKSYGKAGVEPKNFSFLFFPVENKLSGWTCVKS